MRTRTSNCLETIIDINCTDESLNKTEESIEGNTTEDGGSITQSDEGELNRTSDSLNGNLTEDDVPVPRSSNVSNFSVEKNDNGLSKTVSFEDLTQDTTSVDNSNNLFNSEIMSASKQDNLSVVNRTTSTVNDSSVTVPKPKNTSKISNTTQKSTNKTEKNPRLGKFVPIIGGELLTRISNIVDNGNNDETINQLVALTKKITQYNVNKVVQEVDVEFDILSHTLDNCSKAFEQLKDQCLPKKSTKSSTDNSAEVRIKSLLDSLVYTKSQLDSGIASYNEQAKMLESSSTNTINQIKHLWEQYEEIKEMEEQFVKYLDAYRKIRAYYKRLIISTKNQKEKAQEDQERNLTILKVNSRKIQKDVEEHKKILQNKQDNLKELENILELYIGKIDGDTTM